MIPARPRVYVYIYILFLYLYYLKQGGKPDFSRLIRILLGQKQCSIGTKTVFYWDKNSVENFFRVLGQKQCSIGAQCVILVPIDERLRICYEV